MAPLALYFGKCSSVSPNRVQTQPLDQTFVEKERLLDSPLGVFLLTKTSTAAKSNSVANLPSSYSTSSGSCTGIWLRENKSLPSMIDASSNRVVDSPRGGGGWGPHVLRLVIAALTA